MIVVLIVIAEESWDRWMWLVLFVSRRLSNFPNQQLEVRKWASVALLSCRSFAIVDVRETSRTPQSFYLLQNLTCR